jgi:hypothetical protein
MERRHFLKLAVGVAAGAATIAVSAQAAPLVPQPLAKDEQQLPRGSAELQPAVTTADEVSRLKPEEVHWHWHRYHWHRRWHRHRW